MQNHFKEFFDLSCKISKKWDNVNVILKKNTPSIIFQIEAVGPFAIFTQPNTNKNNFILFMPNFSPFNQNQTTIILQPNIVEYGLIHVLTFSKQEETESFLKYWYDSLILVEDMLRAILIRRFPHSEKIMVYNKKSKIFQEVLCVIQAISTLVIFQTQILNGEVMYPGVSEKITQDFSSGIVSPLNIIVPANRRFLSFYVSGANKNDKTYFVCPNRESLMQWVLILHGLSCQFSYKGEAINENVRYPLLVEKLNKMIGNEKPIESQTEEESTKEESTKEESIKEESTKEESIKEESTKEESTKEEENPTKSENEETPKESEKTDSVELASSENKSDSFAFEQFIEEEEEVSSNQEDETDKDREEEEDKEDEKKPESETKKEDNNRPEEKENSEEKTPPLSEIIGVESILPDSIDFGLNEDEKPQVFDSEDNDDQENAKKKKAQSIIERTRAVNHANAPETEVSTPNDESVASSVEDKSISMINPNAYDENVDYYYNIWFKKSPANQPTTVPPPLPTSDANKMSKSVEKPSLLNQLKQRSSTNNTSTSFVSSSFVSTSSFISTDDEPMDVSDESENQGLSEFGKRIYSLVEAKDATGAIAEAIAATSKEKPIDEQEFKEILNELKQSNVKAKNPSIFSPPEIESQQLNFPMEKVPQYLEESFSFLDVDEENDQDEFAGFDDQLSKYNLLSFDKILTNSIEKNSESEMARFDFFDFAKLPSSCADFDPSILNAYDTPSSPFFTDLMIEINNILKIDSQKSITNETARKFTYLLSSLFLNGLRNKDAFYEALKKLEESFSLITPIINTIRETDPPQNQAQSFVVQILDRNLLSLTFREIERNDEWIKAFYLPSSIMLYGSQLTDIVEELAKLRRYEFRLSSVSPESSANDSQNLPLKTNTSNAFTNAVNTISNAVISSSQTIASSAASLVQSSENAREFEAILEKYANVPAFQFVVFDCCDGSPDETVKMFVDMLQECQNGKSLILSPERNAWKFIGEVADLENDKGMNDFDVFKNKLQEIKGGSFIEANRNVGQKMWDFIMEGFKLRKLHVWFLILAINKNLTTKFYAPHSDLVDPFRIKYVASKLMAIMDKAK